MALAERTVPPGCKGRAPSMNTSIEMVVRRALYLRRIGFRTNRYDLPGRPDIVMQGRKAIIQVNGCFWHGHDCKTFCWPKSQERRDRLARQQITDLMKIHDLGDLGYRVLVVWSCGIKRVGDLLPDLLDQWVRHGEHGYEIRG